jgi:hypothetical protein
MDTSARHLIAASLRQLAARSTDRTPEAVRARTRKLRRDAVRELRAIRDAGGRVPLGHLLHDERVPTFGEGPGAPAARDEVAWLTWRLAVARDAGPGRWRDLGEAAGGGFRVRGERHDLDKAGPDGPHTPRTGSEATQGPEAIRTGRTEAAAPPPAKPRDADDLAAASEDADQQADPKAPYMPAGWFKDEFGLTANALRGQVKRGHLARTKRGHWNLYSVSDAQAIWPDLVTYGPNESE